MSPYPFIDRSLQSEFQNVSIVRIAVVRRDCIPAFKWTLACRMFVFGGDLATPSDLGADFIPSGFSQLMHHGLTKIRWEVRCINHWQVGERLVRQGGPFGLTGERML